MKYVIGFLIMCSATLAVAGDVPTKAMVVNLNNVFVPGGFSSDSDAYVVLSGIFPNTCYRWSHAEVQHKGQYEHEVAAVANVSQGMCLMMLVPWNEPARLGRLTSGKHTLRFRNGDGTSFERTLEVE